MSSRGIAWVAAIVVLGASSARAQPLDEAMRLFADASYAEAAPLFFAALQRDVGAARREQAQRFLAESLRRLGIAFAALFYDGDTVASAPQSPYAAEARASLLAIREQLHDPLVVPTLLSRSIDATTVVRAGEDGDQIDYLLGELAVRNRRDAEALAFLSRVSPTGRWYPRARYLLGVMAIQAGDSWAAIGHFEAVSTAVGANPATRELARARDLATLALARTRFGMGDFTAAAVIYGQIPRGSDVWFDALYESAWSYFRAHDYGRALGRLQSVASPYFSARHIPEAYVIQASTYFVNCQWDRVREVVRMFDAHHGPMRAQLRDYLQRERPAGDYYEAVVAGGGDAFAAEIARTLRRKTRFLDYHYMLTHLRWERDAIAKIDTWRGSQLTADVAGILQQYETQLLQVVGSWIRGRLRTILAELQADAQQMRILDFEMTDAERRWLEQGREVLKGRRARLPRPTIPGDQWQHWRFSREYWRDELGYYEVAMRSECE